MDEERRRKIDAGRERLAAYKKRKNNEKRTDSEQSSFSQSDTSLSLSPLPLSETNPKVKTTEPEQSNSGSSSISENIEFSNSENDRSLHEIMIQNIPNLSEKSNGSESNKGNRSNTNKNNNTLSDNSVISLNGLGIFEMDEFSEGTQNILDEIIRQEEFDKSGLDDLSSPTLRNSNKNSETNLSKEILKRSEAQKQTAHSVVKQVLTPQNSTELDSLKEMHSSNPSTMSLGTTTTEYKILHDKINLGTIEFQDILSNREEHIKQLTEALQQVLEDRKRLQEQTNCFAQEIEDLKEQLIHTTAIIKTNNWNVSLGSESDRSLILSNDENKQPKNVQPQKNETTVKNDIQIDFNFNDPELYETLTPDEKQIVDEMNTKINTDNVALYRKFYELKRLQKQAKILQNTSNQANKENVQAVEPNILTEFDESIFSSTFTPEEINILAPLRSKICKIIQQKIDNYKNVHELEAKILHDRLESEKIEHGAEIERLRQLLANVKSGSTEITVLRQELNEQHSKEMEELRKYFEQRCADIEKHYSEEIFSQQSRKMSGSSIGSELESEIFSVGPSGDAVLPPDNSTKIDAGNLQVEIQPKYFNEMEMMKIVQELEQKYIAQIEVLRKDLKEAQNKAVATQEVASASDFEIAEVVQSYERRLQEQVMLAKSDIIIALEQQIQTLVSSPVEESEWPTELLLIRDRLTQHWHKEIRELKEQHAKDIATMKEEHEKVLNRALERERRSSLKNGDDSDARKERDKLKKVSSHLRHLVAELLKYFTKCEDELNNTLVEELLKYGFDKDSSKIESDLNDSNSGSEQCDMLQTQKVKRVHFTPDVTGIINLINESTAENLETSKDISVEFQTELNACLDRLKVEANAVLALTNNLKTGKDVEHLDDSGKKSPVEDKLSSLTRQLLTETQLKNDLSVQLEDSRKFTQSLEAEKQSLETQIEQMTAKQNVLVAELNHAKEKISDLIESGRKEIVSEGYGENLITGSGALGGRIASMAELQDRARSLLADAGTTSHPLLQLIEELCREGDRIMEDAKKDHEDLVRQIEAADKKLRATIQFLEDQAIERELERDEAQKEISALKEQLREDARNRANCDRINKEDSKSNLLNACCCELNATVLKTVEHLEVRMREMTVLMSESEAKKNEVEAELKDAIDKICVLRDIIQDLEGQLQDKTKVEVELKNIIGILEAKIKEETYENEDLNHQINLLKQKEEEKYKDIIHGLESEVQKLRVSSELVGPDGVLKQVKTQLNEFEKTLEKRTKDLETLHTVISNTNCSSPSEDMSIRDQIRQVTHGDGDSDLPLEQLARLKDKLLRHARAEDAAMKRIRDLEMQLFTAKQDYEEMQSERDVLQDQLSEQMMIISSLQLRLDEQRLRVEAVQKQTNTSLEHRIYDLENEIKHLEEAVHIRDKNIKQLTEIVEQSKTQLADQQKQLNSASDNEKHIIKELKQEVTRLKDENEAMRLKVQNEISRYCSENVQGKKDVPSRSHSLNSELSSDVIDTLLSSKNSDIERLKATIQKLEKDLNFYNSLELNKDELMQLSKDFKSKKFTDTVTQDFSEFDHITRANLTAESLESVPGLDLKTSSNDTAFIGSSLRAGKQHNPFVLSDISTIEKIHAPMSLPTFDSKNDIASGDTIKSAKHVHFEDNFDLTRLEAKISELLDELHTKNETLKAYESKISSVSDYVVDIENLRKKLEFSEELLRDQTETYKEEVSLLRETEKDLKVELAEAKMELQQKSKKLEEFEKDAVRKDQMYMSLAKEKRDLESVVKDLESKLNSLKNFENILSDKNKEIYELERQLADRSQVGSVESLKEALIEKDNDLKKFTFEISVLEEKLFKNMEEIEALRKDLENHRKELDEKEDLLEKSEKEFKNKEAQCNELEGHLKQVKEVLSSTKLVMEQLEQDLESERKQKLDVSEYENKIKSLELVVVDYKAKLDLAKPEEMKLNISNLELELVKSRKELAEKDLQLAKDKTLIDELQKDVRHLQEFLTEKDKIIMQMTTDSNSLHIALEAIQSKIQESGNVVDLKKRLREEQNLTHALHEEVKQLRQNLTHNDSLPQSPSKQLESLETYKQSLEKERLINQELANSKEILLAEIQQLKEKLLIDEENIRKLHKLLEEEKINSNAIQLQDASIIESMRLRLEAFLDHDSESERLLKAEKKARAELEKELASLQQRTGSMSLDHMQLNDAKFELTCVKMDLVKMATDNDLLRSELNSAKNLQMITNTEMKQKDELLANLRAELRDLRNDNIRDLDREFKDLHKKSKKDIQRKAIETETKFLLDDLEEEQKLMQQQIDELRTNLRRVQERERELQEQLQLEQQKQLTGVIPDKVVFKMKELSNLLHDHIEENKQLIKTIEDLNEEKRVLEDRIKELEERLHIKIPFDDPEARADYLFGKFLKSESYRKALIFQKCYLLTLLASYQATTKISKINFLQSKRRTGINRFKVAALVIISIHRIQYIVQRWHTGKRIGASVILKKPFHNPAVNIGRTSRASSSSSLSVDVRPWSGNSPPCKERVSRRTEMPLGTTIREGVTLAPLQAPALLTQYIERFDNIQQRLGLALDRTTT